MLNSLIPLYHDDWVILQSLGNFTKLQELPSQFTPVWTTSLTWSFTALICTTVFRFYLCETSLYCTAFRNYFDDGSDPSVTSTSPFPCCTSAQSNAEETWSHSWPKAVWRCFIKGTESNRLLVDCKPEFRKLFNTSCLLWNNTCQSYWIWFWSATRIIQSCFMKYSKRLLASLDWEKGLASKF